jgi:antitoxin component of MazEF toxin-antitoxin module
MKLKVTTVGSSAGVVLPKEILTKLKVVKGDFVFLTESPRWISHHALRFRV